MKKITMAVLVLVLVTSIHAESIFDGDYSFPFTNSSQPETQTLLSGDFSVSGFGGPVMSVGKIADSYAIITGGRGGAIFNNSLIFGAGGYGLAYPVNRDKLGGSSNSDEQDESSDLKYVGFGYGGPMIGVNFFQKSVINLSLTSVIGAGGLYLSSDMDDDDENSQSDHRHKSDAFFVCEPTLMAHVNVTKWFRLGAGVSYRYTYGIQTEEFSDDDFRHISYVISAEFGWF